MAPRPPRTGPSPPQTPSPPWEATGGPPRRHHPHLPRRRQTHHRRRPRQPHGPPRHHRPQRIRQGQPSCRRSHPHPPRLGTRPRRRHRCHPAHRERGHGSATGEDRHRPPAAEPHSLPDRERTAGRHERARRWPRAPQPPRREWKPCSSPTTSCTCPACTVSFTSSTDDSSTWQNSARPERNPWRGEQVARPSKRADRLCAQLDKWCIGPHRCRSPLLRTQIVRPFRAWLTCDHG